MTITNKCPSCGAAMVFDSNTQKMSCEQCGLSMAVQDYEQMYGGFDRAGSVHEEEGIHYQPEMINLKKYHCQSCGAELMADEYSSAVMCAFCGNPSLVSERLEGAYKPDRIIPFKIDKEQAKQAYRNWVKKGKLTPSELSKNSTIDKISGLYVPFWLYDYKARSNMSANATRVRTKRRGNTEYIYTDHFFVYRDVEAEFSKVPADASQKMDDEDMDKMEPYDYGALQEFAMPYLSGYLSERFNYTSEQMLSRVGKRINSYITDVARNTITGYGTVNVVNNQVCMTNTHCEYVLLPVWVLNCRYNNKEFKFMLNGQTGKIVADRPISIRKAVGYGIGIFVASLLIMCLGGVIIW